MEVSLLLPVHLYNNSPIYKKNQKIILVEDSIFFKDNRRKLNNNKCKLVYHRATMKYHYEKLSKKYNCEYINYSKIEDWMKTLKNVKKIHLHEPMDRLWMKLFEKECKKNKIEFEIYDTLSFLTTYKDLLEYKKIAPKTKQNQTSFYKFQRQRLNILMNNGKPIGNKLTYDTSNREALPKNHNFKFFEPKENKNKYIKEAQVYINKLFPNNYGDGKVYFPITHSASKKWFAIFLNKRFNNFGRYQDAIDTENNFLFHSVISPMLNIGLLTPKYVVGEVIKKYNGKNINNVEGYIRQVIGWREFSRYMYLFYYNEMKNGNHFNNRKKLTKDLYEGSTGIPILDKSIQDGFKYGYLHHILRLMVVGNYMNLSGIHPHEVYKWFMEFAIDSYDWVMINNVYSMVMYADGGLSTSKPYISSSNYLKKMSNYQGGSWEELWNKKYKEFIKKNKEKLMKIPRIRLFIGKI